MFSYMFLLFHLEAAFINYVTVETEKRQSVKVKVKAQWASEDKMRDILKFSAILAILGGENCSVKPLYWDESLHTVSALPQLRARIKAVKDYCEKRGDHTKCLGINRHTCPQMLKHGLSMLMPYSLQ